MNPFTNMVDALSREPLIHISKSQFDEFDHQYVLYALKDIPYGRAFCEYFDIPEKGNSVIYHMKTLEFARSWIKDYYLL